MLSASAWLVPSANATENRAPAPPPFELQSYAERMHVSTEVAAQRLTDQAKMQALADAERSRLGSAYGGAWIDNENDDQIVVGIGPADDPETLRVKAISTAGDVGLTLPIQVADTTQSDDDILQLQKELETELLKANDGAKITIDAEPSPKSGSVTLDVPPKDSRTKAQATFLDATLSRYGNRVTQRPKPAALQRLSCSGFHWCDPPLRGGVRLVYAGAGECTGGFIVRSVSNNIRYLLTAGHCLEGRSNTWNSHFADGSSHDIGEPHSRTNDVGLLEITNPSGWSPEHYIQTQSDSSYPINQYGVPGLGGTICMSGAYTDSNCATVTGDLARRDGTPNTLRASFCAQPGDSGAPAFVYNIALGSVIGRYHPCDVVFYSAWFYQDALNVVPLTSYP